jgi:hypothetical protein
VKKARPIKKSKSAGKARPAKNTRNKKK